MSKMVLPTTKPKIVYSMRVEYKKWPYTNFVTNLRNLREKIATEIPRMRQDSEDYGHDRNLYAMRQAGLGLILGLCIYYLSVNGKYFFKRLHTELINDKYIFLLYRNRNCTSFLQIR